jgi:hypothetical protein
VAISECAKFAIGAEVDPVEKRGSKPEIARNGEETSVALRVPGRMLFADIVVAWHDHDVLRLHRPAEDLGKVGEKVKSLSLASVREIAGNDHRLDVVENARRGKGIERHFEDIALGEAVAGERLTMVVEVLGASNWA